MGMGLDSRPAGGSAAAAAINSAIELWGVSGRGSAGSNVIAVWANVKLNVGTDLTYDADAVNGGKITVVTTGLYEVAGQFAYTNNGSSASRFGVTVDQTTLTTFISTVPEAEVLLLAVCLSSSNTGSFCRTKRFTAGQIIRLNISAALTPQNTNDTRLSVTRVG